MGANRFVNFYSFLSGSVSPYPNEKYRMNNMLFALAWFQDIVPLFCVDIRPVVLTVYSPAVTPIAAAIFGRES